MKLVSRSHMDQLFRKNVSTERRIDHVLLTFSAWMLIRDFPLNITEAMIRNRVVDHVVHGEDDDRSRGLTRKKGWLREET